MSEVWSDLQDALSPYNRTPSDVEPDVALTRAAQEFESERFFAGPFGHYLPDDGEPTLKDGETRLADWDFTFPEPENQTEGRLVKLYSRQCAQAITKNRSYGDSALHPIGLFGSGRAKDAIGARIDDKLSRFKNHHGAFGENDVEDLIGYLVLWLLADEDEKGSG